MKMSVPRARNEWLKSIKSWLDSVKKNATVFKRIFSYASKKDGIFLLFSVLAAVCAGATLPLLNIVFARLISTFNTLATTGTTTRDFAKVFMSSINEFVLYIVYLFLGRLLLAYIAILGFRITSLRISAAIRLHYLTCIFAQPISTLDALPPGQITSITTITANILQLGRN